MSNRGDATVRGGLFEYGIELTGDPPTNTSGQYICGRECIDGSQCKKVITAPFMPCHQHETDAPII